MLSKNESYILLMFYNLVKLKDNKPIGKIFKLTIGFYNLVKLKDNKPSKIITYTAM